MTDLALLLLQVGVILLAAQALGWLFRWLRQPPVIGEMAAGILLGPSLLGWAAPRVSGALFPADSLGGLYALSQVGLLIYMFLVGLEFDPQWLRGQGRAALIISQASIVVPFGLGLLLAAYLYPRLSEPSVGLTSFALFMGVAMSITAFPVLARILSDQGLLRTRLGSLAIACAAVDDVTGWTILAFVVVVVRSAPGIASPLIMLLGLAFYLGVMWFGARRVLTRLEAGYAMSGHVTRPILAGVLLVALASGWFTEMIGLHALLGAFFAGLMMPKHSALAREITHQLEGVIVVLLLPLFFAYTGLRTSLGLLNSPTLWLYCGLIIVVATAGKFGGASVAARLNGLPAREAGALGVLMNTRGLIELVVLNIGLDLGVLTPALFTMMVLMALATTFATSPALYLIYQRRVKHEAPTLT